MFDPWFRRFYDIRQETLASKILDLPGTNIIRWKPNIDLFNLGHHWTAVCRSWSSSEREMHKHQIIEMQPTSFFFLVDTHKGASPWQGQDSAIRQVCSNPFPLNPQNQLTWSGNGNCGFRLAWVKAGLLALSKYQALLPKFQAIIPWFRFYFSGICLFWELLLHPYRPLVHCSLSVHIWLDTNSEAVSAWTCRRVRIAMVRLDRSRFKESIKVSGVML